MIFKKFKFKLRDQRFFQVFRKIIGVNFLVIISAYAFDSHSLKHGEQAFLDYCSGCHSLKYTEYPKVSMPIVEGEKWFGKMPPDLSLIIKIRGRSWVKSYLAGFYIDELRPFGTNNKILHNSQMPNVLSTLQTETIKTNSKELNFVNYENTIDDIVLFLTYISEPNQEISHKIGYIVIGFLVVFLGCLYFLLKIIPNREN